MRLSSIQNIDVPKLKEMGKRGVIFDLDNTLGEQGATKVGKETRQLFKKLYKSGFKVGILSNDRGNNRTNLKKDLSDLYIIFDAKKPRRTGFRKMLSRMELKPEEAVMVGDQVFTDIYGANRLGIYSVLVPPVNSAADPFFTKLKRLCRNLLFYLLKER